MEDTAPLNHSGCPPKQISENSSSFQSKTTIYEVITLLSSDDESSIALSRNKGTNRNNIQEKKYESGAVTAVPKVKETEKSVSINATTLEERMINFNALKLCEKTKVHCESEKMVPNEEDSTKRRKIIAKKQASNSFVALISTCNDEVKKIERKMKKKKKKKTSRSINVDDFLGFQSERSSQMTDHFNSLAKITPTNREQINSNKSSWESVIPLALPDDKHFLSELHCRSRENLEFFSVVDQDENNYKVDPNFSYVKGRVGIRCIHCRIAKERISNTGIPSTTDTVVYPKNIASIYHLCDQITRLHFFTCKNMPPTIRDHFSSMMQDGRQNQPFLHSAMRYYEDSARQLGLVDVDGGIRFERNLRLSDNSLNIKATNEHEPFVKLMMYSNACQPSLLLPRENYKRILTDRTDLGYQTTNTPISITHNSQTNSLNLKPALISSSIFETNFSKSFSNTLDLYKNDEQTYSCLKKFESVEGVKSSFAPLCRRYFSTHLTDYMFFIVQQTTTCHFHKSDTIRGKKSSALRPGLCGLCCLYCSSSSLHVHCRSFPRNPDSIGSGLNSFYNHFQRCVCVPSDIKHTLRVVKKTHGNQLSLLPHGCQRKFFQLMFEMMRELDIQESTIDNNAFAKSITTTGLENISSQDLALSHASKSPEKSTNGYITSVTSNSETVATDEMLRTYSFICTSSGWWTCQSCRMVPIDFRADGSLYQNRPSENDIKKHYHQCKKDSLDLGVAKTCICGMVTTIPGFSIDLLVHPLFKCIVRELVGSNEDLCEIFTEGMRLMIAQGVDISTQQVKTSGLWAEFPRKLDLDAVFDAISTFYVSCHGIPHSFVSNDHFVKFVCLIAPSFYTKEALLNLGKKLGESTSNAETGDSLSI